MIIYQVKEFRSGAYIDWGLYSSKELAKEFLKKHGWLNDEDFVILECEVDANINL